MFRIIPILLIYLMISNSFYSFCQRKEKVFTYDGTETYNKYKNIYNRISILVPSFSSEIKLSNKSTILLDFGTGVGYTRTTWSNYWTIELFHIANKNNEDIMFSYPESGFSFFPYIKTDFRHYYNIFKRDKMKKKYINNFSANFNSLYMLYYFDNNFVIGPTWGFQRNKKSLFFSLNLGMGACGNFQGFVLKGIGDIRFGFLL